MRRALTLFFLLFAFLEAKPLVFEAPSCNEEKIVIEKEKLIPRYTIQLVSTIKLEDALKRVIPLPKKLKSKTKIYKIGKYYAARYGASSTPKKLKSVLVEFHKLGFKDAYIQKTTKWHMEHNFVRPVHAEPKTSNKRAKPTLQNNKYLLSDTLLKASKAYKEGDLSSALIYYEMLYKNGYKFPKLINNLCYLYGKMGDWEDAKKIIEEQKSASKFLYAFLYGAVESANADAINELNEYILYDRSGRLALLLGYYYEKKNNINKALGYYKIAYDKNPFDPYNMIAYARALDMQKQYKKALILYQKALRKLPKKSKTYETIQHRISMLKEIL